MILKILAQLKKYREFILLLTLLPIALIFSFKESKFDLLPQSPYATFEIQLEVPGKTANEIEQKVTSSAEKVFNGLPHLLNLESYTYHQSSKILITFKPGTDRQRLFLFVQEKIDRLKILLPDDVKKIKVQELNPKTIQDLTFNIRSQKDYFDLKQILLKRRNEISQVVPAIGNTVQFMIEPDIKKLKENQLGIDSLWKALKVNSFTYNIGTKDDMIYFVDGRYKDENQLSSVIIGENNRHLIHLRDVAKITAKDYNIPKEVKLWFNPEKVSGIDTYNRSNQLFSEHDFRFSYWEFKIKQLRPFFVYFSAILVLQIVFSLVLFRNKFSLFSFLVLDIIIVLHFLFWTSIFSGALNILDLYSLTFSLVFCSAVWILVKGQIRKYFFPSKLPTFIQRTLDQSIIFSLNQFVPLLIYAGCVLAILYLPLFLTDINSIATYIAKRFVLIGLPLSILTIILLSLFSPLEWITKVETSNAKSGRRYQYKKYDFTFLLVTLAAFSFVFYFQSLPFGIFQPKTGHQQKLNKEYRLYDKNLEFQSSANQIAQHTPDQSKRIAKNWVKNWIVSPNGLGTLANINLNLFKMALSDFSNEKKFSTLEQKRTLASLNMSLPNKTNFGEIPIEVNKGGYTTINQMSSFSYAFEPNQIFRMSLEQTNIFFVNDQEKSKHNFVGTFKHTELKPAQKTQYIINSMQEYFRVSVYSLVFCFFLTSIYLNSFLRSFVLLLLGLASTSLFGLVYFLIPGLIHLDSIWIIPFPFWFTILLLLTYTLPMDIERRRGNNLQEVLKETAEKTGGIIRATGLFVGAFLILTAIPQLFELSGGQHYLYNGIGTGFIILIVTYLCTSSFFKLYYITAQESLERLHLKLMTRFYQFKARND
jgi:hypothetical protein